MASAPVVQPQVTSVPPRASEGLGVPLTHAEREGLPLGEALVAGEAEALALTLPPPAPAAVEEGHKVPLPLELTAPTLGVRGALLVAQPLALAQRLGLPLAEAHAVAQPLAVGDRVEDAQTVAVKSQSSRGKSISIPSLKPRNHHHLASDQKLLFKIHSQVVKPD